MRSSKVLFFRSMGRSRRQVPIMKYATHTRYNQTPASKIGKGGDSMITSRRRRQHATRARDADVGC
jgi:hypothetical protein